MKNTLLVTLSIVATAGITAFAVAQINKPPTFEFYGEDVIATNAPDGVIAAARHEVHKAFADWKKDAAGQPCDPSFLEEGRNWTTKRPSETKPTMVLARGRTEFNDARGNHVILEVIQGKDMPTLIFFSPIGDRGAMTLPNAFAASLQKQGIKPIRKP
jgi:hypothetical protein